MISYVSLKFYLNAAFEIISVIFLVIILISCIFKNTKNQTKKEFSLLLIAIILLLTNDMIAWIFDGMFVSPTHNPNLHTLLLVSVVIDFFLYSLTSILFLNYILSLVGFNTQNKKKKQIRIHLLIAYNFIATAVFSSSMYNGWLYSIPEEGYLYYTPVYYIFILIATPSLWLSYIVILRNIKTLKAKAIPLLSHLVLPLLLTFVDDAYALATGYIILAFIAMSIYVSIDIAQDRELLEKETEIARRKAENNEMSAKLMVSQIQPHFLYNTLGTIYQLCDKDAKIAREAIKSFTKYLKSNMESLNKNTPVLFEKELEHTKTYLSIELLRFADVLNVEYDIKCTDFEIPALSLQPLTENAVKHGIRSREEGGTVTISSWRENGKIYVSVHDDGLGYDTSHIFDDKDVHIGVNNVRKRLGYMCGGRLEIDSQIGIGTTATIILEDEKK